MSARNLLKKAATTPIEGFASSVRARPFVKWAGGKRALITKILPLIPLSAIANYHEPFVGGGALFFALESRLKKAWLSDANVQLMITYKVVKDDVDGLINALKTHANKHCKKYYMKVRATDTKSGIEEAAKFIYLNRTCYNGLYRVNSKDKFNVPMGDYSKPLICDEDNLRAVSEALQKANVKWRDYAKTSPSAGDVIYCDPPYDETYNGYTRIRFNGKEQRLLANKATEWSNAGAVVIISNSATDLIRKLYPARKWHVQEVVAPRSINCKGNQRQSVAELLITNDR